MEQQVIQHMHRRRTNREAMDFYERKLNDNPTMPKYNHSLAAIYVAENRLGDASEHYKRVMMHAPNNVMARNDYALLLTDTGKKAEGLIEMKKAMLVQQDHPLLRKNAAALTAKSGMYGEALDHATRAVQLEPSDPVNHRNIAKIYNIRGDTKSALEHNLQSIRLENQMHMAKPNTKAYRAAAVQMVSQGESKATAQSLIYQARVIEGRRFDCETTANTHQILGRIMRAQDSLGKLEKEQADAARRQADKDAILSGLVALARPDVPGRMR